MRDRALVASFAIATCLATPTGFAAPFKLGAAESSKLVDSEAIEAPQPKIPAELHESCFKSCCIARFIIEPNGKASVKLLTSSGSPEIDEIALDTLRRWRFRPAMLNGEPVKSTRRVKIEFEVE